MPRTNGPASVPRALQPRQRAVVDREHLGELLRGALAVRGELDAAAPPLEQRLAELALELAHVAADRGLREVQRLGGAVVAAVADDRQERAQVDGIELHRRTIVARNALDPQAIDHGCVSVLGQA